MMRHLAIANLYYFTLILQPNIGIASTDPSWRPWLPGIALVACVLVCRELPGVIWACVLGIGVDCLSIHRLGVHTVVATSVASCLALITFDHRPRGMLVYGILTFIVTWLWLIMAGVIHGFLESQVFDTTALATSAATRALSTAVLIEAVMVVSRTLRYFVQSKDSTSIVLANRWAMLNGK